MFRKLIGIFVATVLLTFQFFVGNATAVQLDKATRTVPLNDQGDTIVLSVKEVKQGKRLFSFICADCHLGGV
ncbi:MAG: cytochrome c-550, partial [Calothrix sp. MO_167.B42]|nr:cytochrome c-550 [Calothrix sp. MO_167.B42]